VALRLHAAGHSCGLVRLVVSGLAPLDAGLVDLRRAATVAVGLLVEVAAPGAELRVQLRRDDEQLVLCGAVAGTPGEVAAQPVASGLEALAELSDWATASASSGAVSVAFGRALAGPTPPATPPAPGAGGAGSG
jgi:hypothetical protein